MKAVQFAQYGGPEVLQVYEVPDPIPGPSDVLVQVKATTVNRLDLFQRDGSRPVGKLPFTPGLEAAGVVERDGAGFHAGERVMTTLALAAKGGGGYASKIAAPAAILVRIPDGVAFEEAVAAGLTSSTAWGALFDLGHLQAGERVLIWAGASGVGSIGIQFAKHAGCWVVTTAGNSEKAKELQRLGGDLGGQQATVDTQAWRLRRVTVIGGGILHTSTQNERHILELIAQKAVAPVIAHILPVEQAAEAHRLLASGGTLGKIVLLHS